MIFEIAILSLAMLLCLALSFFFSGSETAIISANRYQLRSRHEQGDASAGKTLSMLENTQRLLIMVLIGNNIVSVLLTLFFERLLITGWPSTADGVSPIGLTWPQILSLAVLTPVVVIFAEITPKALFRAKADAYIEYLRTPVLAVRWLLHYPIISVEWLSFLLMRAFSGGRERQQRHLTRQDVINLITPADRTATETEEEDGGDAAEIPGPGENRLATALADEEVPPALDEEQSDERRMIQNIIELHATKAYAIMTPLVELTAVRLGTMDLEGFKAVARTSGYSRFPCYRERIVNLLGIIDVYRVLREDDGTKKLEDFVEKPYYVPESKRVDDLLQEFLRLRIKNAVVVDEYGGCSGLISREDMLEEIVGDLPDELDEPINEVFETSDGGYLCHGRAEIDVLNETLGGNFRDDDWETLAGRILAEMGRVPQEGDEVTIDGWRAKIIRMIGLRIVHVHLKRI